MVSGFITASGVIIALSQLRHILGIDAHGDTLPVLLHSLLKGLQGTHWLTAVTGAAALAFLFWVRSGLAPLLKRLGLRAEAAGLIAKTGPVLLIVLTTVASLVFAFEARGVALVGEVPRGLPAFSMPTMNMQLWSDLALSALLISVIGFVESVSVGTTLAAKRRQRIDANQELIALGAANVASSVSGGFPVTGGFSRSVVNFDAGAETQLASVMTAIGIALVGTSLGGGDIPAIRHVDDRFAGLARRIAQRIDPGRSRLARSGHATANRGLRCPVPRRCRSDSQTVSEWNHSGNVGRGCCRTRGPHAPATASASRRAVCHTVA